MCTHIIAHMAEVVTFICVVCAIGNSNDNTASYYTEITANTWISPSKDTKLMYIPLKLRPFHVKIMVCRSLNLVVGYLLKKKKKKMEKIVVRPISIYIASDV